METSSLDGETDLKPRISVAIMNEKYRDQETLDTMEGELAFEGPNRDSVRSVVPWF